MSVLHEIENSKVILNAEELDDYVTQSRERVAARIQTVNLHHVALARTNTAFRDALYGANRVTADGWPVALYFRCRGLRLTRVTGSQFIIDLPRKKPMSLALLGAAEEAGEIWKRDVETAGHRVVWREHGRAANWDSKLIAERIRDSGAELLIVAVTPPTGELVAHEVARLLPGVAIIAVGGSIDMATGQKKRPQRLVRALGLEWILRLSQEPRRLWRRYFFECVPALAFDILPAAMAARRGQNRSRHE